MLKRFTFIKSYKWRHFFTHYGIIVFLFLSIPFIIVYISLWHYSVSNANIRMTEDSEKYLMEASQKAEEIFSYFDNIYATICNDETTIKYLMDKNISDEVVAGYVSRITKDFDSYCMSNPVIDDIYLLKSSNNYILTTGNNAIHNNYLDNFADKSCFSQISDNMQFLIKRKITSNGKSKECITCYYPIYTLYSGDLMFGTLAINVQTDNLLSGISEVLPDGSQIAISFSGEAIAYNEKSSKELLNRFVLSSDGTFISNNNANVVAGQHIKPRDISLVFSYNSPVYQSNWFLNRNTLIAMFLVILLMSVLCAYIITDNFYKMVAGVIIETTDIMDSYGKSKKHSRAFDRLSKSVISTFEKRAILERTLYDRMSMLRDAQFKALQTQITPHFLFNTLNIISLLELNYFNKQTDITNIVQYLSDILRYSMDTQNYLVSFEDELNYTSLYLKIQKIRYGDYLEVNYNIDDDTKKITILKFILQPILENAIHYSIAKNETGVINLSAYIKDNMLVIDVADNGNALTPETLSSTNAKLKEAVIDTDHTSGLLNTNKRLKTVYGDNFTCEIYSSNRETHVTLKIPQNL